MSRARRRFVVGWCVGLAAVGVLVHGSARACSVLPPPAGLVGMPGDGESGVATDVRLVYDAFRARIYDLSTDASFELTSASGATVPLERQHRLSSHFELVPARALEPLTTYTLHGRWMASGYTTETTATLSFTTGAGAVAGVPAAPVASMRHYRLHDASLTTCDRAPVGTCISLPVGPLVQVTWLDSFGQELGPSSDPGSTSISIWGSLVGGPFFGDLAGIDQGTNFECVILRTRAANGVLSSPTVVCGDDAPLFELERDPDIGCTPEGLTHAGQLVQASETSADAGSGCGVAPRRVSSPSLLAPLLVAAAAIARRRRRRRIAGAARLI